MEYSGYVYLIGSPIFGWYKIGKSITPEIRIKDLGILLPFKIHIIGVWGAKNHHQLEQALHEIHKTRRINGEWFEFSKKEVYDEVFGKLPEEVRVYPISNDKHFLDRFSNIDEDTKGIRKVIGVRTQKLRGNFTPEEREAKRLAAIEAQQEKKQHRENQKEIREKLGFSRIGRNNI
jgi:hypothetical protein